MLSLLPAGAAPTPPTPPTPPTLPPVCDGHPVPVRPVQQQLCAGNCPCRALSCLGPKWLHVNTILSGGVVRQTPTQKRAIQQTQTATHTRTHTNVRVHTHLQILTRGAHTHLHISTHTHMCGYTHTPTHRSLPPQPLACCFAIAITAIKCQRLLSTDPEAAHSGRGVRLRKRPPYLFHL